MNKKIFALLFIAAGILTFAGYAVSQNEKHPVLTDETVLQPQSNQDAAVPLLTQKSETDTVPPVEEKSYLKNDPKAGDLYTQAELFSYALTTVQSEYVDEKLPKELIYGALGGMLGALDPHSQFLTPEDFEELRTETKGQFGGLGIEITTRDGLLTIVTPIEDTPAWNAGLKAGDRIVKIEKDLTRDMNISDAVKKLRGTPGTSVHIMVLRESEGKLLDFDIVRQIIRVQDVKDAHIIEDGIGYLRFAEFRENSYEQIVKNLRQLKEQGANALILDLRNNPGGLLNIAIDISEIFLSKGQIIVSTKGRHPSQDSISISSNKSNEFKEWPIVIMINEGSASGSEIVAGALKDNRRAVILGVKSFGKGSVQSVIPMPDGSGLRLTTAKYFTPSGICIHDIGIKPDIIVERIYPELKEEEDKPSVLKNGSKDAGKVFDSVEEMDAGLNPQEQEKKKKEAALKKRINEDNQIQSAISVIKGIRVYKTLSSEPADGSPETIR